MLFDTREKKYKYNNIYDVIRKKRNKRKIRSVK